MSMEKVQVILVGIIVAYCIYKAISKFVQTIRAGKNGSTRCPGCGGQCGGCPVSDEGSRQEE